MRRGCPADQTAERGDDSRDMRDMRDMRDALNAKREMEKMEKSLHGMLGNRRRRREAAVAQIHADAAAVAVEAVLERFEKRASAIQVVKADPIRRSRRTRKEALAEGKVIAARAMAGETRYSWVLARYVIAGLVFWGMMHFLIFGIVEQLNSSRDFVRYGTGISGGAALGAMAILATVIVALQIAVRSPHDDGAPVELRLEPSVGLARKRVLENLAFACGVAAITVSFAAASRGMQPGVVDLQVVIGAPLGGLLLAALAADASNATNAYLMPYMRIVQRKRERLLLEARIAAWRGESPKPATWIAVLQSILVLVILATAVYVSVRLVPGSWLSAIAVGALILTLAIWAAHISMELRRKGQKKWINAFHVAVAVGALLMVSSAASFQQLSASTPGASPSLPLYLWATGLILLSMVVAFSMTWSFGSNDRPGLLRYVAVQQALKRREQMQTEDKARKRKRKRLETSKR